jgi:hypothetical protein
MLAKFKSDNPGLDVAHMPNGTDALFSDRQTAAGKEPSAILAVLYRDSYRSRFNPYAPLDRINDELHVAWLAYEQADDADMGEVVARCNLLAIAQICDGIVEQGQLHPDWLDEYKTCATWIRTELTPAQGA